MAKVGDNFVLAYQSGIQGSVDVLTCIKAYEDNVTCYDDSTTVTKGDPLYAYKCIQGVDDAENVWSWTFGIGPLQIRIEVNSDTFEVAIKIYVNIPIIGSILIADAVGSLTDGVTVSIGFKKLVAGTVTFAASRTDKTFTLSWEFDAFGTSFKGEKVFDIPWPVSSTSSSNKKSFVDGSGAIDDDGLNIYGQNVFNSHGSSGSKKGTIE